MADAADVLPRRKKASGKHSLKQRVCKGCSTTFTVPGDNDRIFCDEQCKAGYRAFLKGARKPIRVRVYKFKCIHCGARCTAKYCLGQRYCSEQCSWRHQERLNHPERYEPRPCMVCGSVFTPVPATWQRAHCSSECAAVTDKRHKRTGRVRRKAKLRGATVETVDPIKVFERDRWRCQLCGNRTPKSKRGTYDARAPELDHIVPLSQGGEHSYRNTQCSCRACNLAKSGTPLGQMRLFG